MDSLPRFCFMLKKDLEIVAHTHQKSGFEK